MQLAYLGLGRMGRGMVARLLEKNHQVFAWNRSEAPVNEAALLGALPLSRLAEVCTLPTPRVVWLMLPAGEATDTIFSQLIELLDPNDTIIDGSNSFHKDSRRRAEAGQLKNVNVIDVGVSGGPSGARNGACLMIGNGKVAQKFQSLFEDLSAPKAYAFFESPGAGHFVKMVHNGIEYGMMQAIAEGFEVLKKSDYSINLETAADIYNNQSVITSRLTEWLLSGFKLYGPELKTVSSVVGHLGEGQWTVDTAKELNVDIPIIEASLEFRKQSSGNPRYAGKVLSMLRNQFGGHAVSSE